MKLFFLIFILLQAEWVTDYDPSLWIEFVPNTLQFQEKEDVAYIFESYKKVKGKYYMLISYSPLTKLNEQRQKELYLLSNDYDSTLYKNMIYKYDPKCNKDSFKIEFKLIYR